MSSYITFSTNPTVWTAVEGLYISQQKQEGQITGANVNTVGLFDQCARGPLTPQVLGSFSDFTALYGGRDSGGGGAITGKIWKAMLNRKFSYPMVVCRVAADDAVAANVSLSNATPTAIIKVTATSVGTWANGATGYGITVAVTAASDGDANHFNLVVNYLGTVTTYKNLNTYASGADNTTEVIGTSATNLITVEKLANGRPSNTVSDVSLANGTEGTLAVADYEAAFDKVAAHPLVRILPVGCDVAIDASNQATLNGYVAGKASNYPLTTFLMWSGAGHTRADEITAKGTQLTTPEDNIAWCYNPTSTVDNTGTLIQTGCHLDMAVILGNTDVAIHPGDEENIGLLAGVKSVYNDGLSRADLVLLRSAGICTLEHVSNGFQFHSAVASSSVGAIGDDTAVELADVRRIQWLIESMMKSIKHDVKKAATDSRRRGVVSKLTTFAREDQLQEHVVAPDDSVLGPAWQFQFVESAQERARNIAKLMCKIRILPYMLTIVMLTDIGTGVTTVSATK